jgi:FkbM family methyltransferase
LGVGVSCPYDGKSLKEVVAHVVDPAVQAKMRQQAATLAPQLSGQDVGAWLWRSLEKGEPDDDRFEKLMPRSPSDVVAFIEPPVPPDIYREYTAVYLVMKRLRSQGFKPDFVIDVGASSGVWSNSVGRVLPDARYILVDALASKYDARLREQMLSIVSHSEVIECALSNQSGRGSFQVPPDLYGGSLLRPRDFRNYEEAKVQIKTLDKLSEELKIRGRGLLKLDVQHAEHLVLEGAQKFLKAVDVLVVELSLLRFHPEAKILREMLNYIADLGFRYYDDAGYWRSPVDGTLLQKDMVFVRDGLFVEGVSDQAV